MRDDSQRDAVVALAASADQAFDAGDYATALSIYLDVERLAPDDRGRALALQNMAACCRRLDSSHQALAYAESAVELAKQDSSVVVRAQCLLTFGNVLADIGEHEPAKQALSEARRLYGQAQLNGPYLQTSIALSRVHAEQEHDDEATALLQEIIDSDDAPWQLQSQAANNLGMLRSRSGDHAAAVDLLEHDVALCKRNRDAYGAGVALINLSRILHRSGDAETAAARLAEADELANSAGLDQLRALIAHADLVDGDVHDA